ncbi:MAG: SDR family NAD(P)-dependent oxidoreductase, partial [Candidatus Omnitrophica bacterium]|nr:SDR family NAD(P)-dependent oxidoreductase [Candidatus Omnitrophota bacterium]
MNFDFTDKVVIVTGSNRGIGKSIAEHFAKANATVIILGRNQETTLQTCEEFQQQNLKAEGFVCDVTN